MARYDSATVSHAQSQKILIAFCIIVGLTASGLFAVFVSLVSPYLFEGVWKRLFIFFSFGALYSFVLITAFSLFYWVLVLLLKPIKRITTGAVLALTISSILVSNLSFWIGLYVNMNILRYYHSLLSRSVNLALIVLMVLSVVAGAVVLNRRSWLWSLDPRGRIGELFMYSYLLAGFIAVMVLFLFQERIVATRFSTNESTSVRVIYEPNGTLRPNPNKVQWTDQRPNIIFLFVDTLRRDRLGTYGYYRKEISPAMDALARDSVVATDTYTVAPQTITSLPSILTSLYPSVHGCERWNLLFFKYAENTCITRPTLPRILTAQGYRTFASSAVGMVGKSLGFQEVNHPRGNRCEEVFSIAEQWIEQNLSRPFFVLLRFWEPHIYAPKQPAYRCNESYHGRLKDMPDLARHINSNGFYRMSDDDVAYLRCLYDSEVAYFDSHLAKFIQFLKQHQLYDNSVIVLFSDHGEELWEHGGTGHGFTLYQEVMRIPLFFKLPITMVPHRRYYDEPATTLDIVPTVLDAVGLPLSDQFQGKSLLRSDSSLSDRSAAVLFEGGLFVNKKAILYQGKKYIFNAYPPSRILFPKLAISNLRSILNSGEDELYDLTNDPEERNNIVREQPQVAQELREMLFELYMSNKRLRNALDKAYHTEAELSPKELMDKLKSLGYL